MKKLFPRKFSDYPLYIFFWWIFLWGIVIVLSLVGLYKNITPDHQFVRIFDGMYYYVPFQGEVRHMIIVTGIKVGAATLLVGYSWILYIWLHKSHKNKHYK